MNDKSFDEFNKEFMLSIGKRMFESLIGPTSQTVDFDPVEEINRMIDSLTQLIICNPDDYPVLKECLDKQGGYYELIKCSHVDRNNVISVEDKNLKMQILSGRRAFKKLYKNLYTDM